MTAAGWDDVRDAMADVLIERWGITTVGAVYTADAALTAALPLIEARIRAAQAEVLDVYELRERGLRVLGDEQCCELACNGGACETCPCCCAGWCVAGHSGEIPNPESDAENYEIWLSEAREHNPVARRLSDVEDALRREVGDD
jgi:hypothetical protein